MGPTYEEFLLGRLKESYGAEAVEAMLAGGYMRVPVEERPVALDAVGAMGFLREARRARPLGGKPFLSRSARSRP